MKKLLTAILTVAMLLTVTACGQNASPVGTTPSATPVETPEATPTPEVTPTPTPVITDILKLYPIKDKPQTALDTLKDGLLGNIPSYGVSIEDGVEHAALVQIIPTVQETDALFNLYVSPEDGLSSDALGCILSKNYMLVEANELAKSPFSYNGTQKSIVFSYGYVSALPREPVMLTGFKYNTMTQTVQLSFTVEVTEESSLGMINSELVCVRFDDQLIGEIKNVEIQLTVGENSIE